MKLSLNNANLQLAKSRLATANPPIKLPNKRQRGAREAIALLSRLRADWPNVFIEPAPLLAIGIHRELIATIPHQAAACAASAEEMVLGAGIPSGA
jgi:hypothetical protein